MDWKNVEDFYPLSPMQQGMLFHSLYAPGTGMYVEELSCTLRGDLDVAAFERTWRHTIDRHPILRTAFVWEGLKEPIQVVQRQVRLPLEEQDWREFSASRREERLEAFLRETRERGLELSQAPLMRLALIRTADDAHTLVWTHHHILLDGWSIPLLLREVFEAYETFREGRRPNLERPRPFRDYIVWLREQDLAGAEAFWRRTLKGFTAPTPLVVVRPSSGATDLQDDYGVMEIHVPEDTTAALGSLAREHRLTLNTLVQGAWALLLSRYSGEDDVVFGATVSGRPAELMGSEFMMGLFINTLPVRARVPSGASVLPWLKELQTQQVEMRQYEYSPLMQIQTWSEVPRGTPLFASLLVFENFPVDTAVREQTGSLEIQDVRTTSHTNYPLTVAAVPSREMSLAITYSRELFDTAVIKRMMGHLQRLLEGMVADPEQLVSAVPLLTEAERQHLLFEWNDTGAEYPQDQTIPNLFETQASRTPNAVAVACKECLVTYAELNRRANQLARYLRKLGVRPDTLVGICVERSLETVLGVVGILKAGGAYLPLDPSYPQDRLAFMLKDARVPVLLTQQRLVAGLPKAGAEVVCLDADWKMIAQESAENPFSGVGPDNLAYVIYTSGSTGKPKGAMIQHHSALHLATALQRIIYASLHGTPLRLSLNAPLPFDASVQQLIMLLRGHTLYVIPQDARLDGEALLAYVRDNQLDALDCVPSQLKLLLEAGLLDGSGWVPSAVMPGGEAIDETTWQTLRQAPDTEFYNMYGPTECAVDSTVGWVKTAGEKPTIGHPVSNAQLYVLDRHLQPVPTGVPGELHIGGAGVGRGYLNRPQLTADRFIPHPFGDVSGARLYKTGDLVRYLPDGNVEFLGRIDHQVKVRGFRIELGEIEVILKQHPGVREAATLAREDTPGDRRLVAYLVTEDAVAPTVSELRRFLKEKLPDYMVPAAFVTLDALPLLPNAKVDRRALPAPDRARPELEAAFVAPRMPEEEVLAGIWAQILGIERVGVHDDFFELGGDSILCLQVIARAKQAELELTPRQLFQYPTIDGLAAAVGAERAIQAEQGIVIGPVPLTPVQQGFFEHHPLAPHHFNTSMLLEIDEGLGVGIVERTVRELLIHHDALRLRFERISESVDQAVESEWKQVNASVEEGVPFELIDLSGLPGVEVRPAIEARAAELQVSLDLNQGPLMRVAYFDLGAGRADRLLIILHHLVTDGVSWRILMEDFQTIYQQLGRGESVQLPPKTTSYQRWARELSEYAQSPQLRQELDYWMKIDTEDLAALPLDYPGGANTYGSTDSITMTLSSGETQALLQQAPAAYGTQINDVLLTALVKACARWTGSRKLLIEMEGHGREDILEEVDLSRTVGWFTSIFPVLLDLEGITGLGQELKAIQQQLRGIPSRGIGYGLLRYLCDDRRVREQVGALPQPEVNFNYLGQFAPGPATGRSNRVEGGAEGGWLHRFLAQSWRVSNRRAATGICAATESVGPEHSPETARSALLYAVGIVSGGELNVRWLYSREVHKRVTIERLAQSFMEELRSLIAHCLSPEAVQGPQTG